MADRGKMLSMEEIREEVLPAFETKGVLQEMAPYGNGHINETYRLTYLFSKGQTRYILQRINDAIFTKPVELMENVARVTAFLKKKTEACGGDPLRETLTMIPIKGGGNLFTDSAGNYWRMYLLIEDTLCLESVEKPEDLYNGAWAFGNFQRLLADFPAEDLYEVIPDFHNTVKRYRDFQDAVRGDVCGRACQAAEEIRFIQEREGDMDAVCSRLRDGSIPLRVTHNDTKLNNVLFDAATGRGICVIDLDTVMPGSALYDFGDAVRFGASTGAEDERNLELISCDLELFGAYTEGWLKGCAGSLTEAEIRMLPLGAKLMTLECGMRFLTDYLQGDVYFRTHRPEHNLDRARTQLKLVRDMERKWEEMERIVKQAAGI